MNLSHIIGNLLAFKEAMGDARKVTVVGVPVYDTLCTTCRLPHKG
jgi:hypothetical protein